MAEKGIRSYGPGKFDHIVDAYVWALSLEGWEQESLGDVDEIGEYYGWLHLGPEALKEAEKIAAEEKVTLTPEEKALIKKSYGAIYSTNDQGFVSIDYIKTEKELKKKWARLSDEIEEAYEEVQEEQGEEGDMGEGGY